MLSIKTIKNALVTDEDRNGYCFRSSTSQTLSLEELASEMANYNSSFTEADFLGMLNVQKAVAVKYLAKGYSVELPFGTIRPNATGTCAGIQDSFSLGNGDNQISFILKMSEASAGEIISQLEYRQIAPDVTGTARIYRLCTLNADASENDSLALSPRGKIRIHGRNLSFDFQDEKQGVFIENETANVRVTEFSRAGTNIIDAVLPDGLADGTYNVKIVTKPGNSYFVDISVEELTVSAAG